MTLTTRLPLVPFLLFTFGFSAVAIAQQSPPPTGEQNDAPARPPAATPKQPSPAANSAATAPAATPATPAVRPPTPKPDGEAIYTQALNAFKFQDFETAIPLFRKVVANPRGLDRRRQWRAREFLGAALWFSGDKAGASDQFSGLLIKNPQARLDPAYYPPQMIADFVRARRKMIALGMIKPDEKPTPSNEPLQYEPPPVMLSYIPFGVGQIANREVSKGIAFMVVESALAATSVYFYNQNAYTGARRIPHTPGATASQLIPAFGFYLVAAWGIADAVLTRNSMTLPRAGTLPAAR